MDRYIARMNIEHFREMLAKERDPARREKLLRLIAEEEEKLRVATAAIERKEKGSKS
jgi:hypothetical protein